MEQLERQMYLMKLMLVLMRDRQARQAQVRSVAYVREYGELPEDLGVHSLGNKSNEELLALAEPVGIKKRPAAGKCDVYMNELGYVFVASQHPTMLINGAELQELTALAEQLGLSKLTELLADTASVTEHEAALAQLKLSVNDKALASEWKQQWTKLISYWWCKGSASAPSRFPAELVLCFSDPLNMNTWDIYEPDAYIESVWEYIVLSFDDEQRLTLVLSPAE